jgi:hypothetical protein
MRNIQDFVSAKHHPPEGNQPGKQNSRIHQSQTNILKYMSTNTEISINK